MFEGTDGFTLSVGSFMHCNLAYSLTYNLQQSFELHVLTKCHGQCSSICSDGLLATRAAVAECQARQELGRQPGCRRRCGRLVCYDVFTPLQICGAEFGQYPSKGCVNLARVCTEFFRTHHGFYPNRFAPVSLNAAMVSKRSFHRVSPMSPVWQGAMSHSYHMTGPMNAPQVQFGQR